MSQAEGTHRADGISGAFQHFLFAGQGEARDSQVSAQFRPRHLLGPGDEHQDEFALRNSKEQTAYDLSRKLSSVSGSLLERFRNRWMLEEPIRYG